VNRPKVGEVPCCVKFVWHDGEAGCLLDIELAPGD